MLWNKTDIIERLSTKDDSLLFEIDELKETRSQAQNRLLWKWYCDITKALFTEKWAFITTQDLHDWLKEKLIPTKYKYNKFTKKRYKIEKSTAKLSKKQFNEYLKEIDKYLWQYFEIVVLKPTELWYND